MKKKIFLFLFIIITSLSFSTKAFADELTYDVRYDITELNIKDSKITFKGWAFINNTHNFVSYKNGTAIESQYGNIKYGGQRIYIQALDEKGNRLGDIVSVEGSKDYNFYCEMYFFKNGKYECKDAYNKGQFPSDYQIANNKCGPQNWNQCLYEDIGFTVSFDTTKWALSDGEKVKFQIAVTNTDYKNKTNRDRTEWNDLFLTQSVMSVVNDSDNIKIVTRENGKKLRVIVPEGLLTDINRNYILEDKNGNKCDPCKACGGDFCKDGSKTYRSSECSTCHWSFAVKDNEEKGIEYTISQRNVGKFTKGYNKNTSSGYLNASGPGQYLVYAKSKYESTSERYPATDEEIIRGDYKEVLLWSSWVIPIGKFEIAIYNNKKCEPSSPSIKAACNSSSQSFSSTCEKLMVNVKNGEVTKTRANVKISQTGSITTILTPTNTYAGGGFKFGIMYHNTISWSLVEQYKGTIEDITKEMQAKLKENFVDGFGLKNVKFGNEQIPDDYFKQNIKCQETGSFTNGNTLTTMCIVYLPNSVVEEYTGKVTYKQGDNLGLNNKYYTPIDWNSNKKYEIVATISGMDRLKESSVKADSKNKGTAWTGKWEATLNGASSNCDINLYPLYGQPTGGKKNLKYTFIYRPIDLNNPFPNRNPGMNWYDWYNIERNKERLESSYNREQYSITLDSQKTSEIKKYNKDELNKGGYFDWKTIENGQSSFVDKYFDKKRDNIVGDNS